MLYDGGVYIIYVAGQYNNMYYRNITIKSSTAAVGLRGWDSVKNWLKICRLQKNRAVKSRGSLWLGVAKRTPVNEDAIESKPKNTEKIHKH